MAVSYLRNTPITGRSYTTSLDATQLNAALHRIAMTQARCHQPARDLIARRKNSGDGGLEALRVLKRRLSDVVYQALRTDRVAEA